ncbi:STAS domain-containing protein [Burkholderiaceae bacterium]|nr:STAS domain-containing protein [Burkholderiaceae bacterium]MDO7670523.1 STAS domain-containing protein [Burkholderiaceae bacterium]MDO7739099.1 STAS domain-containing protein [Burkholderiaceae bacterium]
MSLPVTIALPQSLTHESSAQALDLLGNRLLASASSKHLVVDAGALQVFDSSALSVLLGLRRLTVAQSMSFEVASLPVKLQQLAVAYGVDRALGGRTD